VYAITSDAHRGHDPGLEVAAGVPMRYLERPPRAEAIRAALGAEQRAELRGPDEHGLDPVLAVHDPGLVRFLEQAWAAWTAAHPRWAPQAIPDSFPNPRLRAGMGELRRPPAGIDGALGYWCFDTATPLVAGTWPAARAAVDVGLTAVDAVLAGARAAYGLCRPPGHHAPRAAFGGYCYLNNAAIAAEQVCRRTGGRVSVLDLDYHHGNGTQQVFYERADVQYVSLHGDPDRAYPYFAGYADETGAGAGRGATLNLPLPRGLDDGGYLSALGRAAAAIDAFDPDLLVVSFGTDGAEGDPLGDFRLSGDGFAGAGAAVAALGRPTVVLQEGGYAVDRIGADVTAFLRALSPAAPARAGSR
jgi:acetoin utilization deacetylase AcuC-like enzyme